MIAFGVFFKSTCLLGCLSFLKVRASSAVAAALSMKRLYFQKSLTSV